MGVTLAIAAIGAGASIYASNKNSKAVKQAAAGQNKFAQQNFDLQKEYLAFLEGSAAEYAEKTEELLGMSRDTTEDTYGRIQGIIQRIPSVEQLYPRGEALSRKDFDFRTGIKRENLDFILGDTADTLRETQQFKSELANLEEGAFTGKFGKIIRSNLLGLKANTIGEPTGSFANLSARNLYDFSSKALGEFLSINDFYSKEGTVDPISPYAITQDLFTNEFNLAGLNIGNERWRAESLININGQGIGVEGNKYSQASGIAQMGMGISQQYFNALGQNAGAEAGADAMKYQGIAQGIGLLGQGISSAYGIYNQQQTLQMQKQYQTALIQNMNTNSLQGFAPATISSSSSALSKSYNPSVTPLTPGPATPSQLPVSEMNLMSGGGYNNNAYNPLFNFGPNG